MASVIDKAVRFVSRIRTNVKAPYEFHVPSSLSDPSEEKLFPDQLMKLAHLDQTKTLALTRLHDDRAFSMAWETRSLHPETRRWMRKLVQIQTLNAIYNGYYRLPDETKISLDKERMREAAVKTRQYLNDHTYDGVRLKKRNDEPVEIFVFAEDCIDVAMIFKKKYPQSNPLILNMASANNPGGGWRNGAGAQEENLHRRSNMCQCLEDPYRELEIDRKWNYYVPEFGGIYSPNVSVFRGSENHGYPFFADGPEYFSFIAVAAYSNPPTETNKNGELRLSGKNFINNLKRKIDAIFKIALENNHDILILSALGCGAYQNPPRHIAELFKQIIEEKYSHAFKCIVFAIIDDHNANKAHNPSGNIQPFVDVFKTEAKRIETE